MFSGCNISDCSVLLFVACGKEYLATVSEKNSVGFLYDVSDITSPILAQVFHLSPASETKNPVVAYEDRTLGEIDAESIIFFEKDDSPSGNPAILFAGAFSSTTSFWEFDCGDDAVTETNGDGVTETNGGTATETKGDKADSSAFAAAGSLAASVVAIFVGMVM